MNYEELLKRAKLNLPRAGGESRFEMLPPDIVTVKRQTTIKNFSDIAKTLRRDPRHIAKFLFKELAAPGTIQGNELVLQGKIPHSIIARRINEYAKEYVMCRECGKPDTLMSRERGIVAVRCEACGARRTFRNSK